jgi:RNA polymerase sigma factor (sigma-70 family)
MNVSKLLEQFALSRSEPVFNQLMVGYVNLVYSIANRRLGNSTQVEEVVQDVFIRLARLEKLPRTESELMGWFHATTHRISIDRWRKDSRRQNRETTAVEMPSPDSPDELPWKELAPLLDSAIAELEPADRQAILLRFFQDEPFKVVAQNLGVTDGAAKMRVGRALEKLRTKLSRNGIVCSTLALSALLDQNAVNAAPAALSERAFAAVRRATFVGGKVQAAKSPAFGAAKVLVGCLIIATAFLLWRVRPQSSQVANKTQVSNSGEGLKKSEPRPRPPLFGQANPTGEAMSPDDPIARLRQILDQARALQQYPPNELLGTVMECKERPKEALSILEEYLKSPDYETRHWAAEGLKILTQLAEFNEVRTAARRALMQVAISTTESEVLRQDAFMSAIGHRYALGYDLRLDAMSEPIPNELLEVFASGFSDKGYDMVSYLGLRGFILAGRLSHTTQNIDGYRALLESTLTSGDSNQRFAAAIALSGLPGEKSPQMVAELSRLLNSPDSRLPSQAALHWLEQLGRDAASAIPALAEFAEHNKENASLASSATSAIKTIQSALNNEGAAGLESPAQSGNPSQSSAPPTSHNQLGAYFEQLAEELKQPEKFAVFVPEQRRVFAVPYWTLETLRQAREEVASKADPQIAELLRQVPIELRMMEDKPRDVGTDVDPRELLGRAILVAERSDGEISADSIRRAQELMAQEQSLLSRTGDLLGGNSNAEKLAEIAKKIGLIDPKLYNAALKSFLDYHPELDRLLRGTKPAPAPPPDIRSKQ